MTMPRVSVCLPNLNTRPFLEERVATIHAQTLSDWELVVSDNHSEDGAWEFFQAEAERDPRVRIAQAPRNGMYANWNSCIARARGEFIYIATSDDTMAPDCLDKLVAALDRHPDCDIAHCALKAIDETGSQSAWQQSWDRASIFARSSGALLGQPHLRLAPFDGLLHLLGESVYISTTQLLVRRSLFDRVGLFESRWGSVGDFNWAMRAALVVNTVHVPDTWGGWRLHSTQATAAARVGSADHARKIDEMVDHAVRASGTSLGPALRQRLESQWSVEAKDCRAFAREIEHLHGTVERRNFILKRILAGSPAARGHVKSRLLGHSQWSDAFPELVREWLQEAGVGPVLLPAGRVPLAASRSI